MRRLPAFVICILAAPLAQLQSAESVRVGTLSFTIEGECTLGRIGADRYFKLARIAKIHILAAKSEKGVPAYLMRDHAKVKTEKKSYDGVKASLTTYKSTVFKSRGALLLWLPAHKTLILGKWRTSKGQENIKAIFESIGPASENARSFEEILTGSKAKAASDPERLARRILKIRTATLEFFVEKAAKLVKEDNNLQQALSSNGKTWFALVAKHNVIQATLKKHNSKLRDLKTNRTTVKKVQRYANGQTWKKRRCNRCMGKGVHLIGSGASKKCPKCKGKGLIKENNKMKTCPDCKGMGKVRDPKHRCVENCKHCHGNGCKKCNSVGKIYCKKHGKICGYCNGRGWKKRKLGKKTVREKKPKDEKAIAKLTREMQKLNDSAAKLKSELTRSIARAQKRKKAPVQEQKRGKAPVQDMLKETVRPSEPLSPEKRTALQVRMLREKAQILKLERSLNAAADEVAKLRLQARIVMAKNQLARTESEFKGQQPSNLRLQRALTEAKLFEAKAKVVPITVAISKTKDKVKVLLLRADQIEAMAVVTKIEKELAEIKE